MGLRVLYLYRPTLPGLRAQAIQVLHAAHALAARGHQVTLLADRAPRGDVATALASFGLPLLPSLDLQLSPSTHPGLAGLWFRAGVLAWALGPPGVVLARDRRRLRRLLPLLSRHRVVLEAHGLDSALAREAGQDPGETLALERAVLARASALIANCEGTLLAWEAAHGPLLPARRAAVHNGTAPGRLREEHRPEPVIRAVGSLRAYKGMEALARAAPLLPLPLELVGGSDEEIAALGDTPGLRALPPLPFLEVPDLLARSAALLLPLADNLFGRELTSPLKLWDYLASPAPILAPDLPSVTRIAARTGATIHLFRAGDAEDLARAAREALAAPPRHPTLRTWDQRAAEIEELLR